MKPLRTLITPIIIAAVAVAGVSAAPARAETSDLAKLLIGIGAIAIIANATDKKKSSSSSASRSSRVVTIPKKHKKKARFSYAIPSNCVKTYSSSRGDRELYSGRCLSNLPYRLAKLPEACAYTIAGRTKSRGKAYGPRCMAKNGFYQVEANAKRHGNHRHIVWNK